MLKDGIILLPPSKVTKPCINGLEACFTCVKCFECNLNQEKEKEKEQESKRAHVFLSPFVAHFVDMGSQFERVIMCCCANTIRFSLNLGL